MNLVERAQRIITQPKQEWYVIQPEPTQPAQLYPNYIIPLAAIGPVASIIGFSIIGIPTVLGSYKISLPYAVILAIISFALDLGSVYIMALIIDALAPNFSGQKNFIQAFKVATYCRTPAWIGGIFQIFPAISFLAIFLGLYGLFILYLGLPVLMQTPPDKAVAYTVVVIVIAIVLFIVIGAILGAFTGALIGGAMSLGAGRP